MNIRTRHIALLFDIDGTLIDAHQAGTKAFNSTINKMFGWDGDSINNVPFAGQTDLGILHMIMHQKGIAPCISTDQKFVRNLPLELSRTIKIHPPVILPGILQLLDKLQAMPGVILGLLTGNIEACAHIKLSPVNLNCYFKFGAFGHEHHRREHLATLAKERVHKQTNGSAFDIVVIGDTPNDVAAAKSISAPCIAVATGLHSAADLAAAGADYVFTDFAKTTDVLDLLQAQFAKG